MKRKVGRAEHSETRQEIRLPNDGRHNEEIIMTITKKIALVAFILTLLTTQQSANAAALHTAVDEVVEKLSRYLKSKAESQISIGQFVGPPQVAATSGPGIAKVFHTCFEKHNCMAFNVVNENANNARSAAIELLK